MRFTLHYSLALLLTFFCSSIAAQTIEVERIDPPNWWVGMHYDEIQLLVYGANISTVDEIEIEGNGIVLKSTTMVENPNYLFLDLEIRDHAKPGSYSIHFRKNDQTISRDYELLPRRHDENEHQGFDASDVLYLLMPDRFANGDPENDTYEGMTDEFDRSHNLKRHGGDLQGIIDHMEYFNDLGVTTLWLNPVQENDMPVESYHGYAITDMYKIDRRLGNNVLYQQFVRKAHQKGLKVIMDMVVNHIGTNNYLIQDLPMANWIHQFGDFTRTNYRGVLQLDPYASDADLNLMNNAWFDRTMADLNQQNLFVSNYFIQNTIWWIEYAGLDGIRMDTYSYPDKEFLADWAETVFEEYPEFEIVGEVWENRAATQAYWLSGANHEGKYDSKIHSITDFVLKAALDQAFTEDDEWDKGLPRIFYTLTEDRLYPDANALVTFIDNHDVARYFTVVGEQMDKMKMGLTALLTLRGIPQLYYGSELAFTGGSHGEVRPEMFGGWRDHQVNAFTGEGLSNEEKEIQEYTRKLLQWRKETPVVQFGKMMHFIPEKNTYVYFRYDEKDCVMVAFNKNNDAVDLESGRFNERLKNRNRAINVISGEWQDIEESISLPPNSVTVLELK